MDLRNVDWSIYGKYLVITETKEVYLEEGMKLLGKLPKANMTEGEIAQFLQKKKGKDDATS